MGNCYLVPEKDYSLILKVLADYLGKTQDVIVTPAAGGLRNAVYIVRAPNLELVVKIFSNSEPMSSYCHVPKAEVEYAASKMFVANCCNVPDAFYYDSDLNVIVFEHIQGRNLRSIGLQRDKELWGIYANLMQGVAAMHGIACDKKIGSLSFEGYQPASTADKIFSSMQKLAISIPSNLLNRLQTLLSSIEDELSTSRLVWGNIQLHTDNIIVQEKSGVAYICDFEKIRPHFPETEIATLISCATLPETLGLYCVEQYLLSSNTECYNRFSYRLDYEIIGVNMQMLEKIYTNRLHDNDSWNIKRGETIARRVNNLHRMNYSSNIKLLELKKILLSLISSSCIGVSL